ncbi:winged helix-turn-helix domain-containing protein [Burkholderia glumae]|uniref:winged helix-turn-helix domain-containing protein n=1 Tax=Burkholderia glumae TaxID=337 RepID=UPI002036DCC5|nr:winged helix-turn-helix domain-containing protein [Burkholderia glumae]MCM2543892.1 winged helix-turn-helix domain-containing protein [Burkholderia glumae]
MAERKMRFTSRMICECVRDNPGVTTSEVARTIGVTAEGVKKAVNILIERGYIARRKRNASGYPMEWTGKPFPPASESVSTPQQIAIRRAREHAQLRQGASVLSDAMRAMVLVGRSAA